MILRIPPHIEAPFNSMLFERAIPGKAYTEYRKRLRYYPDSCRKYHFHQCKKESLPHVMGKSKPKNGTQMNQKQTSNSVCIYYKRIKLNSRKKASVEKMEVPVDKKQDLKFTNADRSSVYNDLQSEMKIRRYTKDIKVVYRPGQKIPDFYQS